MIPIYRDVLRLQRPADVNDDASDRILRIPIGESHRRFHRDQKQRDRSVAPTRSFLPPNRSVSAAARSTARCMPLLRRSCSERRTVAHEHNLPYHASLPEQLLRASCLGKRKSLRDERLDLLLLKEVEQGDQVLPKQSRL